MSKVLLLNATYEPLNVISTRRAVVLIMDQKAEVIESQEGEYRSASTSMPVPAVIRLRYFVKIPYRSRRAPTRRGIMARDAQTCQYCGDKGDTIDHVHPKAKGGKHVWENVVAACKPCNSKKADRLLSETTMRLKTKPEAPKRFIVVGVTDDPAWEPYLGLHT